MNGLHFSVLYPGLYSGWNVPSLDIRDMEEIPPAYVKVACT
jgi:hypothetical protein